MIFNKNTVLIVYDVQQNIEIVKGFLVEEAFTSEKALENVKNNDYNLILLDIMLGDSNGFDVCTLVSQKNKN